MAHLNPAKLFFELPPINNEEEDEQNRAAFDSYEIDIYELTSPEDTGTLIDTVRITPGQDWVETNNVTSEFSWFRLVIKNEVGDKTLEADSPILSEKTSAKIAEIREAIKDTNRGDPAFSNPELLKKMRLAAMRLNNISNLSSIEEKFWPIIELLVRIDICNVLAFDYAKYLRLEIPGGASLARDELHEHYINVCKSLQEYYEDIQKDARGEIDKAGDGISDDGIRVSTMERMSYESGLIERSLEPAVWYLFLSPIGLSSLNRFLTQNRNLIL